MGCILEFLVEFIFEEILGGYINFMTLVVPQHKLKRWVEIVLKVIIAIFSIVLLIALIAGLFMLFDADPEVKQTGKFLTFGSLSALALHIILTIIVRLFTRNR